MTAFVTLVALAASASWVELPFKVRGVQAGTTPRELAARGYPPTGWTSLDLELEGGARLRAAVLGDLAGHPPVVSELALLPVENGRATFDAVTAAMGTRLDKPFAEVRPVTCEAFAETSRLELPAVGTSALRATAGATWRAVTCDRWSAPWLALTFERSKKQGSLFLRVQPQTTWAVASATVGSPGELPHAGARFEDWKLLDKRPLGPVMVWQRRSLALGPKELVLTELESGTSRRVAFDHGVLDVGCASLNPLSCVALLDSRELVLVDVDKKTTVPVPIQGVRAGLEMAADGEHVALATTAPDAVNVAIYRRSKKTWVQHAIAATALLDLGKWSETPSGFVVTITSAQDGGEYAESLLLSLDETTRQAVPRTGPSWLSPLGRKLEQRGAVTWLHVPQSDGSVRSRALEWATLRGGPNAWLSERYVLSGGGSDVSVLDLTSQTQLPLLDPELHLGRVYPAGDDPSWVVVLRPEGTYRARLSLP